MTKELWVGGEWTRRNERFGAVGQKRVPSRGVMWLEFYVLKGALWLLDKTWITGDKRRSGICQLLGLPRLPTPLYFTASVNFCSSFLSQNISSFVKLPSFTQEDLSTPCSRIPLHQRESEQIVRVLILWKDQRRMDISEVCGFIYIYIYTRENIGTATLSQFTPASQPGKKNQLPF